MVAAGNGARYRDHRRRDYRLQLRPRGGRDDDLADQRATAPARPRAGGTARGGHERQGRGRRHRRQRHRRRAAPVGDRQRREVLPADRRDSQSRPDGGAHLGQHQPERRRPRAVVRGLRQPHPGTGRAGGRPAELGQRREVLPVSAARLGRCPGRPEPGVARRHVRHGGREDARPLAPGRRRLPAPAGRLGAVRAPRRGRDPLLGRGARHDRRGLRPRPHGQRPLLRPGAGGGRRGRFRRQRASHGGLVQQRGGAHRRSGAERAARARGKPQGGGDGGAGGRTGAVGDAIASGCVHQRAGGGSRHHRAGRGEQRRRAGARRHGPSQRHGSQRHGPQRHGSQRDGAQRHGDERLFGHCRRSRRRPAR